MTPAVAAHLAGFLYAVGALATYLGLRTTGAFFGHPLAPDGTTRTTALLVAVPWFLLAFVFAFLAAERWLDADPRRRHDGR